VAEDSARWPTQAAGGVRKVLSPVTDFHTSEENPKRVAGIFVRFYTLRHSTFIFNAL
jgi:hypothetical protein